MYIDSEEHQILVQLFPKIIKKFKKSYELWDMYLEWAFKIEVYRRRYKKQEEFENFYEISGV